MIRFVIGLVLLLVVVGCGNRETAVAPDVQVEGPALLMFYTDN